MAEPPPEGLDNNLADAHAGKAEPQGKKEEHKIGTLESVVNETLQLGKSTLNLGLAAGIPLAQASLVPYAARDTAVLAGAQVAADATNDFKKGKKFTAGSALESSVVGTAITVPTYHMFNLINKIPTNDALGYVTKGAAWGGIAYPAYLGMYQFMDYIIRNRKIKGVGKYIKENYWPTLRKAWKTIFPISLFNIFLVPAYLQVPVSAILSYAFALFGAPKKAEVPEDQKRDKTPYYAAASSVTGKLARNTFKAFYEPLYALGSAAKYYVSKLNNSAKGAAKPTAQTQGAAPAHS